MSEFTRWANLSNMRVHDPEVDGELAPADLLPWVDIETTGLNMKKDVVLEVGIVLTDAFGRLIEDGTTTVLVWDAASKFQTALGAMPEFVRDMHTHSGLLNDLRHGQKQLHKPTDAADVLREFLLDKGIEPNVAEFAGSSVHFDREMLRNNEMEDFEGHFHYRNLDVSSIKNACRRLNPSLFAKLGEHVPNNKRHRPLDDLLDSIREYQFYIDNFLWTTLDGWNPLDGV